VSKYVASSPHFFRPVKRSLLAGLALLFLLAALLPAPLEVAADPSRPPNPAKSAWFLLWIQELVSWNTLAIYAAVALAVLLVALPWLAGRPVESASWFPRNLRVVVALVLFVSLAVLALTAVGLFFRGPGWRFVAPF
jgi:hypothetical protein